MKTVIPSPSGRGYFSDAVEDPRLKHLGFVSSHLFEVRGEDDLIDLIDRGDGGTVSETELVIENRKFVICYWRVAEWFQEYGRVKDG